MLKVRIPTDAGNRAIRDGSLQETFDKVIARIKPEAVYYSMDEGKRCVFMFYEISESAAFLSVHEPFFQKIGAEVFDAPALSHDDMVKGWAAAEQVI
ncbi:MAG: hypothetical protein KDA73_07545 [Rhodobacteraceae bacterium]|nr:hypothetical protein [Paracoccaceae bacterium]